MKKLALNLEGIRLSRDQMKKIVGGSDSFPGDDGSGGTHRCVLYCCPINGSCAGAIGNSYDASCMSNEECQRWGLSNGATCPEGAYVAGLCK